MPWHEPRNTLDDIRFVQAQLDGAAPRAVGNAVAVGRHQSLHTIQRVAGETGNHYEEEKVALCY